MTMAHDLLAEPLLTWRDHDRRRSKATLPGMLALLGSGELADFPRLRAHQFHPWSMFLTQLAVLALRRSGESDPKIPEGAWRDRLLELTGGESEPWCLVVEDLSKAAFFQPAVPEGSIESWKGRADHPDDIDILVTSKGHDVKRGLMPGADVESWVYALVTLQTMEGYSGGKGGYKRVSRMRGGYDTRPRIGITPDHRIAGRFVRDLKVMSGIWAEQLDRGYVENGVKLTWLTPWDGESSLSLRQLSPFFVEICRRIRLEGSSGEYHAVFTTSKNRRCVPEIENGDVADPWIPVEGSKGALTVSRRGFDYRTLTRLLGGDFEPAPTQTLRKEDGDPVTLHAAALARGQGKTQGLHERPVLLAGEARRRLAVAEGRAAVGQRAQQNVLSAEKMRAKVLCPALRQLALGDVVTPDRFHSRVDEMFFRNLFGDLERSDQEAQVAWERALHEAAWAELQIAIECSCVPVARRYRAITEAEDKFRACFAKNFPDAAATLRSEGTEGNA